MDLKDLKAGDEVAVDYGFHNSPRLAVIERVTKTQIIIGSSRYRREGGYLIGAGSWNFNKVVVLTEKIRSKMIREGRIYEIENFKWKEASELLIDSVFRLMKNAKLSD